MDHDYILYAQWEALPDDNTITQNNHFDNNDNNHTQNKITKNIQQNDRVQTPDTMSYKTSDNINPLLYLIFGAGALIIISVILLLRRKYE